MGGREVLGWSANGCRRRSTPLPTGPNTDEVGVKKVNYKHHLVYPLSSFFATPRHLLRKITMYVSLVLAPNTRGRNLSVFRLPSQSSSLYQNLERYVDVGLECTTLCTFQKAQRLLAVCNFHERCSGGDDESEGSEIEG